MLALLQLIGILPILGLAATSSDLERRQDSTEWVKSSTILPKNTRIVNQSGYFPGVWGPGPAEDTFKRTALNNEHNLTYLDMTMTDEDGWNRRPLRLYIYRDTGVELKFDKEREPLNPLPDRDILYNLTCYHAVHKSAPDGAHFFEKLDLSAETIISPYGNDTWDSLRGKANFYCPSGGCVHADCQGQYFPTWTQELYDEQHGNTTAAREPITQVVGTNSTSSSSVGATQSA